jgi:hypothetical protein
MPPAVFDGTRALADEFWAQFRRYKMVNRTHDSMTKAYNRVLTALTYIWGPMINKWVNAQESQLSDHTDTTKPNHVCEDDKCCGWNSRWCLLMPGQTHSRSKTHMTN